MEASIRKDLSHTTWEKVFDRQALRATLREEWMNALQLKPGDRVLEVGAGPGYASLVRASRVGPDGLVYAVDRSPEALAYLERLQSERGVPQIPRLGADAATLEPGRVCADSAVVAMVLHHTVDPASLLTNVARLLPAGALAVGAQFHPEGPCLKGPPRPDRLMPEQVRAWCEGAAFGVLTCRRRTPAHSVLVVQRRREESSHPSTRGEAAMEPRGEAPTFVAGERYA